jgi:hypothetical protein
MGRCWMKRVSYSRSLLHLLCLILNLLLTFVSTGFQVPR